MIAAEGLTVEFGGTTLFKNISFVINEKDRIALMGKNGAGKSTLIRTLSGAHPADSGEILINGQHVEIQRGAIKALIGPNGAGKTTFFNLLTGFSRQRVYRKLTVAPSGMRERVLQLIERETAHAKAGQPARNPQRLRKQLKVDFRNRHAGEHGDRTQQDQQAGCEQPQSPCQRREAKSLRNGQGEPRRTGPREAVGGESPGVEAERHSKPGLAG